MDIQVGYRITCRDIIKDKIYIVIINDARDLTSKEWIEKQITDGHIEILKIERPKYEVVEEKKELLTADEKKFLENICKHYDITELKFSGDYLDICNNNYIICCLDYPKNMEFRGVEIDKKYTLKELGLEEN